MKQLYNGTEIKALRIGTGLLLVYHTSTNICVTQYKGTNSIVWTNYSKWRPLLGFTLCDIEHNYDLFHMYALTEMELQFYLLFSRDDI